MHQSSGAGDSYLLAEHTQRINGLEDLLRRNESSVTLLLGRLKDVELGLNAVHRSSDRFDPEVGLLHDDITTLKRKVDVVDHVSQSKLQDLETKFQQEVRNNRPPPISTDPAFLRMASELQVVRQDEQETSLTLKRLADTTATDGRLLRQVEQDAKWLTENLREHIARQTEWNGMQQRRNESLSGALQEEERERSQGNAQLRGFLDVLAKTLREEMASRFEAETKSRVGLQNEVVGAFSHMREDVVKGFSQTAANLRNLDDTAHSLETVLRAEVRSRMTAMEESTKLVQAVEDRVRRELSSAAEYMKSLDAQMSGALRDVREITAAECRSQLDRIARTLSDLQARSEDNARKIEAQGSGEVENRRRQLQVDSEMANMRREILDEVDKRVGDAMIPKDRIVTKSDLEEYTRLAEFKMEEMRVNIRRQGEVDAADQATKLDAKMAVMTKRVEQSEMDFAAAGESLRSAQREMTGRASSMERQAQAMESLQRELQIAWERDQTQMASHLQSIREQVSLMAEEMQTKELWKGVQQERTGNVPPAENSGSNAVVRMLDGEVTELKKEHTRLESLVLQEVSHLKASTATLGDRIDALPQGGSIQQSTAAAGGGPSREDFAALVSRVAELEARSPTEEKKRPPRSPAAEPNAVLPPSDVAGINKELDNIRHGMQNFEARMLDELGSLRKFCDGVQSGAAETARAVQIHDAMLQEIQAFRTALVDEELPALRAAVGQQQGMTINELCQKYNISEEELRKLNPHIENVEAHAPLPGGMTLNLPDQSSPPPTGTPPRDDAPPEAAAYPPQQSA